MTSRFIIIFSDWVYLPTAYTRYVHAITFYPEAQIAIN